MTLVSATAVAQVLAVGVSPVLSRLYEPAAFGQLAAFLAVTAVLASVATLRYESAIVLPEAHEDAVALTAGSIAAAAVIGATVFVGIALVSPLSLAGTARTTLGLWIWAVPAMVVLQGIQQSLRQWDNRHRAYGRMATNAVIQSAANTGGGVAFGLLQSAPSGLLIAAVGAQAVATGAYVSALWTRAAELHGVVTAARVRAMLLAYREQALFGAPALLTSSVAQQSLFALIGTSLGAEVLGYVFLIHRVVGLPSAVVGSALGDVFLERIAREPRVTVFRAVMRFATVLAALGLAAYVCLAAIIDAWFLGLFGTEWAGAVPLLTPLIVVAFFSFVFAPLSVLFNYFQVQRWNLFWQGGWLVGNIVVFAVGDRLGWSAPTVVAVYAVKQAAWYCVGIGAFMLLARRAANEG